MKCFNCGKQTSEYLCSDCRNVDILDKIFEQIRFYNPETCENEYLIEYASSLTEPRAERNCIPDILKMFSDDVSEYYFCLYNWMVGSEDFESIAEKYLSNHSWEDKKSQFLIFYLLKKYIRNDFVKPRKWCDWIMESDGINCELYLQAATYFGMIAEYGLADKAVAKGLSCNEFLYSTKESTENSLKKQKNTIHGYRTKKPYWPTTEERRRAVAMFYDEKGISYPRIESKPPKVPENKFEHLSECFDAPSSYCSFWCAEAFCPTAVKPIYQIAAVKVEKGNITDSFQSFVRPWDGSISRQHAAKEAGVPLDVIEGAKDVDQVMSEFFEFVGNDVLISTDALGSQAKLISRAARYSGMSKISNEFFELLDMAADADELFDSNYSRQFLLKHFNITEGRDALEKAKANILIYEALKNYES